MTQSEKMALKWSDPDLLNSIDQTMDEAINRFFKQKPCSSSNFQEAELIAAIYDEWVDYSRDQVSHWYVSLRPITIKLKEVETGKVPQPDIVRWVPFSASMFERIANKITNSLSSENSGDQNQQSIARKMEQTLVDSGIRASVLQIHVGPTVCRYELEVESDTDIDLTFQLESDLSLALALESIRIIPHPSMSRIQVELPNEQRSWVTLKELKDRHLDKTANILDIPLGRESSSGEMIWGNLGSMPHLLLYGASQSGKTNSIRSILSHLLSSCDPDKVHFSLIQGDTGELSTLIKAPHVISSVENDPAQAYKILRKLRHEMETRFALLQNQSHGTSLPWLVVVIDEFAPLFAFAPQAVEEALHQLTQKGHLVGIHIILAIGATAQEALTEKIKVNFHSRLVFKVPSLESSMMILDQGDAEKLLGSGDALFQLAGGSQPVRIQTALTSSSEAETWLDWVTHHEKNQKRPKNKHSVDEIYEKAVEFIIDSQTASVSMLQRKFRIGYTRASRLIDHMEKSHIIGPLEGSKPREVLIKRREKSEVK